MPLVYPTSFHSAARAAQHAVALGAGLLLLPSTRSYLQLTVNDAISALTVPFAFGQMEVIRYSDGRPSAIVTWAWLSDDTIARLNADPACPLHISELTEGYTPCISGVFPCGGEQAVQDFLRHKFADFSVWYAMNTFGSKGRQLSSWDQMNRENISLWLHTN